MSPAATSVRASHSPPSREPSGSQLQAGGIEGSVSSRTSPRRSSAAGGLGLTLAHGGVPQVSVGVLVVEGGAQLALPSHRVVFAVVAHASTRVPGGGVHGRVKVARRGVLVALAL